MARPAAAHVGGGGSRGVVGGGAAGRGGPMSLSLLRGGGSDARLGGRGERERRGQLTSTKRFYKKTRDDLVKKYEF